MGTFNDFYFRSCIRVFSFSVILFSRFMELFGSVLLSCLHCCRSSVLPSRFSPSVSLHTGCVAPPLPKQPRREGVVMDWRSLGPPPSGRVCIVWPWRVFLLSRPFLSFLLSCSFPRSFRLFTFSNCVFSVHPPFWISILFSVFLFFSSFFYGMCLFLGRRGTSHIIKVCLLLQIIHCVLSA